MKDQLFKDIMLEIFEIFDYANIDDKGTVWEELESRIDYLIESNTSYHHQIETVIQVLEGSTIISEYEIDAYTGKTYKAHEFREAKRAYAQAYLYQKYHEIAQDVMIKIYSNFETFLFDANDNLKPENPFSLDDITISFECDNCWAIHNRESSDGKTFYWLDNQLDGLNGISRVIYGLWISINYQ